MKHHGIAVRRKAYILNFESVFCLMSYISKTPKCTTARRCILLTAATGQYYNYNYNYYCEGAGDDSNNISECCQLKPVWRVIGVEF